MGIKIQLPDCGENWHLTILNALQARSDIMVKDCGCVVWDYWPLSGPRTEPGNIAGMVLDVLGGNRTGRDYAVSGACTLKGNVGQVLRAGGLNVSLVIYEDDAALDVCSEIVAVNPELPECGRVRVNDEGYVTWECRLDEPPSECALAVTDTIVPILVRGISFCRPDAQAS